MLKNKLTQKYILGFAALLFIIGVVLSGSAIAMGGDEFSYLKTTKEQRKWYQLIAIDEDNHLTFGIHFNGFTISGGEIDLNND